MSTHCSRSRKTWIFHLLYGPSNSPKINTLTAVQHAHGHIIVTVKPHMYHSKPELLLRVKWLFEALAYRSKPWTLSWQKQPYSYSKVQMLHLCCNSSWLWRGSTMDLDQMQGICLYPFSPEKLTAVESVLIPLMHAAGHVFVSKAEQVIPRLLLLWLTWGDTREKIGLWAIETELMKPRLPQRTSFLATVMWLPFSNGQLASNNSISAVSLESWCNSSFFFSWSPVWYAIPRGAVAVCSSDFFPVLSFLIGLNQ